jgi:energy-coupling factor transporter ATP-binding protein EcfA2
MNTKLILIEGLPGSGKSTTAGMAAEILKQKGIETNLFLEGNLDHPADYDGVAFFSKGEWNSLLADFPSIKALLNEKGFQKDVGYFLPYQKLGRSTPDGFFERVLKHDVYELPLDLNIKLIKENWKRFGERAKKEDMVYIFECCFIQNPVTVGMVKYGASNEMVKNYVLALEKSIRELNPILIYINQRDLDYSFKKAIKERPQSWSEGFINYYTIQGHGKLNHLAGVEGTIKVLKARRELELDILNELSIRKSIVDNSSFDKNIHKNAIEALLNNHLNQKGNV